MPEVKQSGSISYTSKSCRERCEATWQRLLWARRQDTVRISSLNCDRKSLQQVSSRQWFFLHYRNPPAQFANQFVSFRSPRSHCFSSNWAKLHSVDQIL